MWTPWSSWMKDYGFYQAIQIACLVLLFGNASAIAQQTLSLDMATVAGLARDRSWSSKQAHQEAAAAVAVAQQASSMRWGRVDFQSQYLRLNDPIEIKSPIPASLASVLGISALTTPVAPVDNLHVALEGRIPLFTGGKITNAIREAKAGSKAVANAATDTDNAVVFAAEKSYLSVLLAQEVVELNEKALRSYNEHRVQAEAAFRQGTAAKYDVIRAEAAVADQDKKLIEARNQLDLSVAALRTSLSLEDNESIQVHGNLVEIHDDVNRTQMIDSATQTSALLKALEEKISASHSNLRVQQGNYLPQVTGVAEREMVDSKLAQTDPTWAVGGRVTLQLFDGGERRAKVSQARAQLKSSEYEYHHVKEQLQLAVRSACLDFESGKSELISARKSSELAAESLRLATKRFEVGTGTSLEVLDANVSLTAAEIGIQRSLFDIDLAYLQMHRYAGDIAEVAARIQ